MTSVTYMAPCSETPLMVAAFLMALLMVLSGYWVILKWVAKVRKIKNFIFLKFKVMCILFQGNLDLPKLSSVSGMMPRVYTIGGSID